MQLSLLSPTMTPTRFGASTERGMYEQRRGNRSGDKRTHPREDQGEATPHLRVFYRQWHILYGRCAHAARHPLVRAANYRERRTNRHYRLLLDAAHGPFGLF